MYKYFRTETNPLTNKGKHVINYKTIDDDLKSLRRALETKDEYVAWVTEWKEMNAELIKTIQYFRAMKNRIKYDAAYANSTSENCNHMQLDKKWFGKIAHKLYELRRDNKAWAKAQAEKVLEAA